MTEIALLILGLIVLLFGAVILFGAPYVPTMNAQRRDALNMLDLKKGQTVMDLGSGDGSFLKTAAESGLMAIGYELNPLLVIISRLRTFRQRQNVKIYWRNFWKADISKADGVFVFLLPKYMNELDRKLSAESKKGTKMVSYAFQINGKKPSSRSGALFLYKY